MRRWKGLDVFSRRAPYFASIVILCVGLYIGVRGLLAP
jgi:ABC-type nickel/cobalt efflux system permease component RcnA